MARVRIPKRRLTTRVRGNKAGKKRGGKLVTGGAFVTSAGSGAFNVRQGGTGKVLKTFRGAGARSKAQASAALKRRYERGRARRPGR